MKFKWANKPRLFTRAAVLHFSICLFIAYFVGFWEAMILGLAKELLDGFFESFPEYFQDWLKSTFKVSGTGFSLKDLFGYDLFGAVIGAHLALRYGLSFYWSF